jgi:hypothetical protein
VIWLENQNWQEIGENVYSRFITISGQVENTWVKAPKRIIESINVADNDGSAYDDSDGQSDCPAGICIIGPDGGEIPEIIDTECETWAAKDKED